MILDMHNLFTGVLADGTKAQAITTQAVGTVASTNVIDMGAAQIDADLSLVVTPTVTFTSAGAATVAFALQDCDTVDGTYVTVVTTGAIPVATLAAGYVIRLAVPPNVRQFTKILVTVAAFDLTAGTFLAGYNLDLQTNS